MKRYITIDNIYNKNYETIKIEKIIKRVKNKIILSDNKEYKQVTIKLYGKGIILRTKKNGKDIKTKNQYLINEGQFLYSKISI